MEGIKDNILNYIFGDEEFRNENFYSLMSDTINLALINKYDINAFVPRFDLAKKIDVTNYERNFIEINYTVKETNSTNFKFRCTQVLNVYLIANICKDSNDRINLEKSALHFVKKASDQINYKFVQRINENNDNYGYKYMIYQYPYYNVALYNIFQEYAYIYENIDEALIDNTGNKFVVMVNIDDVQIVYDHPKLFESNNEEAERYFDMIINEISEQQSIVKVEENYIFNIDEFVNMYPVLVPQGKFKEFAYFSNYKMGVANMNYGDSTTIRIILEFYKYGSQGNENVNCSDENGTKQIIIEGKSFNANVCRGDRIAGNVVKLTNVKGYDIYVQAVDYSMNPEDNSVDIMPREFRFMTADESPKYEMKVQQS